MDLLRLHNVSKNSGYSCVVETDLGGAGGASSSAWTASLLTSGVRCEYRSVISMLSCPRSSWTALSDFPRMTRWEAKVWRSPCVVSLFASPAFLHVEGTTSLMIEWVSLSPASLQKT